MQCGNKIDENFYPHFLKSGTREFLQTLMKEKKINKKVERELLSYFDSGKSFPYGPPVECLDKPKSEVEIQIPEVSRLPPRPMQRTKNTIEQLGAYAREQFRPTPSKTRPAQEKERLQNRMAFGKDFDPELKEYMKRKNELQEIEFINPEQQFNEILVEIQERKEFLDDMTLLGKRKEYFSEIHFQILQRLGELEKLDEKRAQMVINEFEYQT